LSGDLWKVDPFGDDLVVAVAKHAEDFGGERLVEELVGSGKVQRVVRRDGPLLD